jgi:hypothetical protein
MSRRSWRRRFDHSGHHLRSQPIVRHMLIGPGQVRTIRRDRRKSTRAQPPTPRGYMVRTKSRFVRGLALIKMVLQSPV